jgi:hypothetical protein
VIFRKSFVFICQASTNAFEIVSVLENFDFLLNFLMIVEDVSEANIRWIVTTALSEDVAEEEFIFN